MDPKEWQRLADEVAREAASALDEIEAEFWPEPGDPSFRSFWPRIRALSDRLQTAPAIDTEVKLSLLGRVRQLTKRARQDQEVFFAEQRHRKQETLDQIEQIRGEAAGSTDASAIRRLRQDLMAVRDTLGSLDPPTRGERQEVWQSWQAASQSVWDRLNEVWGQNERDLMELLESAQGRLDRGDVRETREFIRRFNSRSRDLEVSHKSSRSLRARANAIWKQADEVANAKRETFMATAGEKVERWKEVQGRNARAIARIRSEIADLEREGQESGVAAAFAKAMIEDKMRELARLENTNESLEDRIETTEAVLSGTG